jgi:hypothetical protein
MGHRKAACTAQLELVSDVLTQPYAKVVQSPRHLFYADKVGELMRDFHDAISAEGKEYYLGAIALEQCTDGTLMLRDGRMRLMVVATLVDRIQDRLSGRRRKRRQGYPREVMQCIDEFLDGMLKPMSKAARGRHLRRWLAFVERRVMVATVTAPPEVFLRRYGSLSTMREVRCC